MSFDPESKVSWTTADTVTHTELNRIGNNQIALWDEVKTIRLSGFGGYAYEEGVYGPICRRLILLQPGEMCKFKKLHITHQNPVAGRTINFALGVFADKKFTDDVAAETTYTLNNIPNTQSFFSADYAACLANMNIQGVQDLLKNETAGALNYILSVYYYAQDDQYVAPGAIIVSVDGLIRIEEI